MKGEKVIPREFSITDELALVRTKLANERTFLAYLRTFVGAFAAGIGLIKFTEEIFFVYAGFTLAGIAPIILLFGTVRAIKVKREIELSFISIIKSEEE